MLLHRSKPYSKHHISITRTILYGLLCGLSSIAAANWHEKYAPTPDAPLPAHDLRHDSTPPPPPQRGHSRDTDLLEIDADTLLAQPELLKRAMFSALSAQHVEAVQVLLPLYQQLPERDTLTEDLAQALLARAAADPARLHAHLARVAQQHPDAAAIRFQLATALYADRQYREAEREFTYLNSVDLPEAVAQDIDHYRRALRAQNRWQKYVGAQFLDEKNVNGAPRHQRIGTTVIDPLSGKPVFQGFSFEDPIHARGIAYQFGVGKRFRLANGFFVSVDNDTQGKYFHRYGKYNDVLSRFSAGVGRSSFGGEWQLTPYWEKRWFSNRPYSTDIGITARGNRALGQRFRLFTHAEAGKRRHDERRFLDNRHYSINTSLLYQHNAAHYWLAGADFAREYGTRDADDSFRRYSLRLTWGQNHFRPIASQLTLATHRSNYDGATVFSKGRHRRDREQHVSLSLWNPNWRMFGITPRLTASIQRVRSNDLLRDADKKRIFVEMKKEW